MPIPTNTRNITTLNVVNATNNTQSWTYLPVRTAVKDNENPAFGRIWTLTAQGVMLTTAGSAAGVMLEPLAIAMIQANPSLTWAPNVGTQPSSETVGWANTASFSIAANDEITNFGLSSDLTYRWQVSINGANFTNVSNGGVYSNATTNTLNISNSAWLGGGNIPNQYRCVVTNPSGSTNSNAAALTTDPYITAGPNAANVNTSLGLTANFSIAAVFLTTPVSSGYQWQVNTGGGFGNISTAGTPGYANYTTNTLSIANVSNCTNAANYRCLVVDSGGEATSNQAELIYHS